MIKRIIILAGVLLAILCIFFFATRPAEAASLTPVAAIGEVIGS